MHPPRNVEAVPNNERLIPFAVNRADASRWGTIAKSVAARQFGQTAYEILSGCHARRAMMSLSTHAREVTNVVVEYESEWEGRGRDGCGQRDRQGNRAHAGGAR